MKANELRLGNWILNGINEPFQTNGETINNFNAGQMVLGSFNPIPLTEKWLIKFGFKRLGKDTFYFGAIKIHHRKRGFVLAKRYADIEYVHQLQNLVFALTQFELEN